MKNKKSLVTIILAAVLILCAVSGCGSKSADDISAEAQDTVSDAGNKDEVIEAYTEDNAGDSETAETESVSSGEEEADGDDPDELPMIGIVTNIGGIDDGSFNQSAWEGLLRLEGTYGCETRFFETDSNATVDIRVKNFIAQGGDLCWAIGYDCADALLWEAESAPWISFAIIDYEYEAVRDNMTCVVFRAEESSFIAGYIAANVTKTGKVGFIGGMDNEVIDSFKYGFINGVKYASDELGKNTEVVTDTVGAFDDTDKGLRLANAMYSGGCDIIFHAAGESGLGVITAARDTGNLVIGVDKDQAYLAPDNVLTSVIKNVNQAIYSVSEEYINGQDIGGMVYSMGLAEGAVGISEDHSLYSDELYDKALAIEEKIIAGDIEVPVREE